MMKEKYFKVYQYRYTKVLSYVYRVLLGCIALVVTEKYMSFRILLYFWIKCKFRGIYFVRKYLNVLNN